MTIYDWSRWYWKLGLVSALSVSGAIASFNCTIALIGAILGANLFHSSHKFNVDTGRRAYFTNLVGIENILSWVTGATSLIFLEPLVWWAMPTCFWLSQMRFLLERTPLRMLVVHLWGVRLAA